MPHASDGLPILHAKAMKKIFTFLAITVLSVSCSLGELIAPPLETPLPSVTPANTDTPLPTSTPVTPTLTFTFTPTLMGLKTPTPADEITSTPVISVTPLAMLTLDTLTPTVQMKGFFSVLVSPNEFFKGRKCEPASAKFIVQVDNPLGVAHVLLFVRFKSLTAERAGKWTSIPMEAIGAGTYVHELYSDEMLEDAYFQTAWVQYQIVSTNARGRELGRTDIFKENLSMLQCVATATPATLTP